MTGSIGVLGVLGCAGSVFASKHSGKDRGLGVCGVPCWVCWVIPRVRMCVAVIDWVKSGGFLFLMREEKPSTPNTLSTDDNKLLSYKGFSCAWFVLGMAVSVLGRDLGVVA